ncbi:MAG: phosphoribosylaminoimidazolesuccinocarboxamide synthase [Proteobacteria bacterium]|nr:phosphoribosylaminoimidazolesuccinocarboxamide synthase [Pseudomonadota bacterium]MDA0992485.1 phosphoribosylaminoimidazolesuccinocarboxamide synthase [Pseudomonadota bacterium]
MKNPEAIFETTIPGLEMIARGKVRDIYSVDDEHLLIITTDRLSAYDVVMPDPVPGKGEVLTTLSNFWFVMMEDLIPNHLTRRSLSSVIDDDKIVALLESRSMVVRRLKPLPIEAVVRGYLIGSGWNDYRATGAVCGIDLPDGLKQASRLPETIFTPATKADAGDHDENVSFERVANMIGNELATQVRDIAIRIYERAAGYALDRGIIIADTKFEFGQDSAGKLYIIDEVLTPDSSRFWPSAEYEVGTSPPSFDKQYVRDYLETLDWGKTAPAPKLPDEVLRRTGEKYREAMEILTG